MKVLILIGIITAITVYIDLMLRHLGKKQNKQCNCETKSISSRGTGEVDENGHVQNFKLHSFDEVKSNKR
jgi:hypothetical protein